MSNTPTPTPTPTLSDIETTLELAYALILTPFITFLLIALIVMIIATIKLERTK